MKTSDLADEPILQFLAGPHDGWPAAGWATWFEGFPNSVQNAMPAGTPSKLALSKMASMIRRGVIDGCACGCRGDFRLPKI